MQAKGRGGLASCRSLAHYLHRGTNIAFTVYKNGELLQVLQELGLTGSYKWAVGMSDLGDSVRIDTSRPPFESRTLRPTVDGAALAMAGQEAADRAFAMALQWELNG